MKKSWIRIGLLAVSGCLCVKYSDKIFGAVSLLVQTLTPLFLGFVLAYILDILMKKLEKIYFPGKTEGIVAGTRRPVCVFASILLVFLVLIALFMIVVPSLRDAIYVLTKDIPKAFVRFQRWLAGLAAEAGYREIQEYISTLKIDWNTLYEKATGFLTKGIGNLFTSAFSMANLAASFAYTGIIAVIFAIYMLFQKENLKRQLNKLSRAYIPERARHTMNEFFHLAHNTFTSFISGQILEAVILGSLCGAGMFLLRLPYAMMTGVIVGASALIPVMGAYIGAAVGAFMILTVSPVKTLVFLVYLVILQQVEGNVIYPRVVGGSIGLPGIWVLAAVTVGGGLFGIQGMLIGVPLSATLYKWLRRDVNARLQEQEEEND